MLFSNWKAGSRTNQQIPTLSGSLQEIYKQGPLRLTELEYVF